MCIACLGAVLAALGSIVAFLVRMVTTRVWQSKVLAAVACLLLAGAMTYLFLRIYAPRQLPGLCGTEACPAEIEP